MPDLLLELFSEEIPSRMHPRLRSEARTRKQTIKALHVRSAN